MPEPMIKCPGCEVRLPQADIDAQKAHMEAEHPDLIAERLTDAGFEEQDDGTWRDTLAREE